MSNPYASPTAGDPFPKNGPPANPNSSYVNQITLVGILMIVFGALTLITGLVYVGLGFFMSESLAEQVMQQQQQMNPQMNQQDREFMKQILFWTYSGMGAVSSLGGLILTLGGISVLRRTNRTFGIIACIAGLLGMASCYCTPLSIGICVYGLIILLNRDVKVAFESSR